MYIEEQKNWIRAGNAGCIFAAALVRKPELINWNFTIAEEKLVIPLNTAILSIVFPNSNVQKVKEWSLNNGFYLEDLGLYEGLRLKIDNNISWVQYFGPDSHVKTRQTPHSMLSFTLRLPIKYYCKVGFHGVLHLAHASIEHLLPNQANSMWSNSFKHTEKVLGHKPTLSEAAKTTFKK